MVNSYTLAKLKIFTSGNHQELRYILSTFLGQTVDNSIFMFGAFFATGWYSFGEVPTLIISSVMFCTVWEVLAIPLTRRFIKWIKEQEGIDTYDHGTDFNPFKLG
jgi:uncharacterized PurR-regulated membrane protein YhhQ (DUF165 family)